MRLLTGIPKTSYNAPRTMSTVSPQEFAEIFPDFRTSSPELVSDILSCALFQRYSKGMMVYSEGDACSAISFVLAGEIRVFKTGDGGREITLYEVGRGETCILNASCILSNVPYPAHAVTLEDGEMLLIPASDFRRLIARHEEMRDFVFSVLSQRLSSVMALVEEVAFGRMDERIMEYLVEKAGDGRLTTTHQKIADDLGTSREVISRLLKDFEKRGLITLSRNLIQLSDTHRPL